VPLSCWGETTKGSDQVFFERKGNKKSLSKKAICMKIRPKEKGAGLVGKRGGKPPGLSFLKKKKKHHLRNNDRKRGAPDQKT